MHMGNLMKAGLMPYLVGIGLILGLAAYSNPAEAGCAINAQENNYNCQANCQTEVERCREWAWQQAQECAGNCTKDEYGNVDEACIFECNNVLSGEREGCMSTGNNCLQGCEGTYKYESQYCQEQYGQSVNMCEQQYRSCQASGGIACPDQYDKCMAEAQSAWGY